MQEVLYGYTEMLNRGQSISHFFEWDGEKFKDVTYKLVSVSATYGKVYIKYSNEKDMIAIIKK